MEYANLKIEVRACGGCPFMEREFGPRGDEFTCGHIRGRYREVRGWGTPDIPRWCPLRKGPVTVELKEGE